jgi:hypothetical protein
MFPTVDKFQLTRTIYLLANNDFPHFLLDEVIQLRALQFMLLRPSSTEKKKSDNNTLFIIYHHQETRQNNVNC